MNWIACSAVADEVEDEDEGMEDENEDEDIPLPAPAETAVEVVEAGVETAEGWLDDAIEVTAGSDKMLAAESDVDWSILPESENDRLSPEVDSARDDVLPVDATPHDDKATAKAKKMIKDVFFICCQPFMLIFYI